MSDGRCPLTVAAAAGRTGPIDLLVGKYGMNPRNMDVVCAAARHNRVDVLHSLWGWCDDTEDDPAEELRTSWTEVMETKDREGVRPMMAALINGSYSAMQALARMGADPQECLFELVRIDNATRLETLLKLVLIEDDAVERLVNMRNGVDTLLTWAVTHASVGCMPAIISAAPDMWKIARDGGGLSPIAMILEIVKREREGGMGKAMLMLWIRVACNQCAVGAFAVAIAESID
jgi:hypothetical protein